VTFVKMKTEDDDEDGLWMMKMKTEDWRLLMKRTDNRNRLWVQGLDGQGRYRSKQLSMSWDSDRIICKKSLHRVFRCGWKPTKRDESVMREL
jgi:hypothetical protein